MFRAELFRFLFLKLSQAAASEDNRAPTPSSVAEQSSQQALPDMCSTDSQPEVKAEEDEVTAEKKDDCVKTEVNTCITVLMIST